MYVTNPYLLSRNRKFLPFNTQWLYRLYMWTEKESIITSLLRLKGLNRLKGLEGYQ